MLQETDWETALAKVAEKLGRIAKQHGGAQIGAIASPNSTLEELHLLSRVARGLGSANLDHRLRRTRFPRRGERSVVPVARRCDQGSRDGQLGAGRRLEHSQGSAAARASHSQSGVEAAARFLSSTRSATNILFPVAGYLASNGLGSLDHLVAVTAAAINASGKSCSGVDLPRSRRQAQPNDAHKAIAQQLSEGERRLILLGALAQRDPAFADLRSGRDGAGGSRPVRRWVICLKAATPSARTSWASCRAVPLGGQAVASPGLNIADMFAAKLKAYILFGAIEPKLDIAAEDASAALEACGVRRRAVAVLDGG